MTILETERLRCEPLRPAHAAAMLPVLQEPRIYTHIPGAPPASLEDLERRYSHQSRGHSTDGTEQWRNWILSRRDRPESPIGFWQATVRDTHASIAYVLHPDAWGQGLAQEASIPLIAHLFEAFPSIAAVQAEIHVENRASLALVQRLGFQKSGHDPEENDDIYQMTREQWRTR